MKLVSNNLTLGSIAGARGAKSVLIYQFRGAKMKYGSKSKLDHIDRSDRNDVVVFQEVPWQWQWC